MTKKKSPKRPAAIAVATPPSVVPGHRRKPAPSRAVSASKPHVLLLAGTRHGLFLFRSGAERQRFELRSQALLGMDVADAAVDPRSGALWAAAGGRSPGVFVSRDEGRSWTRKGVEIGAHSFTLLAFGPASAPKTLYAAASPAQLHRSTDDGDTWHPVWSLNEHPSRREWTDHGCGLEIRALVQDPRDAERLWVAITGAGVFRTDDGGLSWNPNNAGIPSHASPLAIFDGLGRCPHNLAQSARGTLWLVCHDGVYKSSDGGDSWVDRSRALPTRFAQALALHRRDEVVLLVPESPQALSTNGDLAVWRGSNGGRDWERSSRGFPARAFVNVAPRALSTDPLDPLGVYLGTSSGRLLASRDEGRSFSRVAEDLPEIHSVHAALCTD